MHRSISLMFVSLGLVACFPAPPDGGGGGGGGTPDAGGGNACTRQSASGGSTEGFPFDSATFDSTIFPALKATCQLATGCHAPGNLNRFTVYSDGDCPDDQTFNEVFAKSDYMNGSAMSLLFTKANGTSGTTHPVYADLAPQLQTFIDTAKMAFEEGGGGGGGGGDAAFDRGVFSSQIQPIIDNAGCIGSCHVAGGNAFGNFGLNANARPNTPELEANVKAVVAKIDLTLAPTSATQAKIYVKATDNHSPSPISDTTARGNLEAWIAAGLMGQ